MAYTFHGCSNLPNIDFNNFDVSSVTTMQSLFYGCKSITSLDLSSFITKECHMFEDIFGDCNEMNVTIDKNSNEELIKSAPDNIHFIENNFIEVDFLFN